MPLPAKARSLSENIENRRCEELSFLLFLRLLFLGRFRLGFDAFLSFPGCGLDGFLCGRCEFGLGCIERHGCESANSRR